MSGFGQKRTFVVRGNVAMDQALSVQLCTVASLEDFKKIPEIFEYFLHNKYLFRFKIAQF